MIPGSSLLPFVPGGGGEIPDGLELELSGVGAQHVGQRRRRLAQDGRRMRELDDHVQVPAGQLTVAD